MATNKIQHPTYQQSHSSIIFENDQVSNANEPIEMSASIINGNSSINNLKNCIQKLQSVSLILSLATEGLEAQMNSSFLPFFFILITTTTTHTKSGSK